MTIIQAILLGAIYWINTSEMFVPFTYNFTNSPLVVSLWVGLILGDVPTAVMVGATVMPMYLALVAVGGAYPIDKCAAGIIPAALAITEGISLDQALALAAVVALLMAQLHTVKRVVMVWTVHQADKCAEKGDVKGIYRVVFLWSFLIRAMLFWVPMTLILYFGGSAVGSVLESIPSWLNNALIVVGGLMPALGYAMTIMVIGHGSLIPFFLAGFFLVKYTGLGNIPIALVGVFFAWLYLTLTKKEGEGLFGSLSGLKSDSSAEKKSRILDKKTLRKSWLLWRFSSCAVDNVERLQALAFCTTMIPVLQKLYPDKPEEIKAGLQRHMTFFITENLVGAMIPAIVISMEEERALGAPISDEAITGVKTGLMGPFAGIGDTLNYSTIWPLLQAFFIPYGLKGYWWAALAPGVIGYTILTQEGRFLWNLGYKLGTKAALSVLQTSAVQRIISFFSVFGLFVLGGLAAGIVDVQTAILIPKGDQFFSIQKGLLDAILPGILSLATIFGVYKYLQKGGTILKATLALLIIGLLLGSVGILGTPAV